MAFGRRRNTGAVRVPNEPHARGRVVLVGIAHDDDRVLRPRTTKTQALGLYTVGPLYRPIERHRPDRASRTSADRG